MALKISQPLSVNGLQQLTCQTDLEMSYVPGPEPFSAASPPVFIVLITLKEPDTSGEQTSSDQVQDTSGDDQEDLHRHIGTKVVQQGTHCKTTNYTNDNWDWER